MGEDNQDSYIRVTLWGEDNQDSSSDFAARVSEIVHQTQKMKCVIIFLSQFFQCDMWFAKTVMPVDSRSQSVI